MTNEKINSQKVLEANIQVHSQLVKSGEYQKSPHFRKENIQKVKSILAKLFLLLPKSTNESKAVDFGCGTGFIINLIYQHFFEVHGVDICKDMMEEINISSGNIYLHKSIAEKTFFLENSIDFASAYSFMDHLFDYKIFLNEVYRVLKKGGVFYSDLNPNRDFIIALQNVEKSNLSASSIVNSEIGKALHNSNYYRKKFNVESIDLVEPIKTFNKGFDYKEVLQIAKSIGFSKVDVEFEWFLNQGSIFHNSTQKSEIIEEYLNSISPISSSCFKYLRFIFIK